MRVLAALLIGAALLWTLPQPAQAADCFAGGAVGRVFVPVRSDVLLVERGFTPDVFAVPQSRLLFAPSVSFVGVRAAVVVPGRQEVVVRQRSLFGRRIRVDVFR
jgi:hypothetical protein